MRIKVFGRRELREKSTDITNKEKPYYHSRHTNTRYLSDKCTTSAQISGSMFHKKAHKDIWLSFKMNLHISVLKEEIWFEQKNLR